MSITIQISLGDYIDRMTILEIKKNKMKDKDKLKNINNELNKYLSVKNEATNFEEYHQKLFDINTRLWHVEDRIRVKEQLQEFDTAFIQLARSVYKLNDIRANLKRQINTEFNSDIIEEKQLP